MTLKEQRELLEDIRNLVKELSLDEYLKLRIVHVKGTLERPERYRAWIYAHGYKDPDDGTSSPWLLEVSWAEERGAEWLADYLIDIAEHADNWEEND